MFHRQPVISLNMFIYDEGGAGLEENEAQRRTAQSGEGGTDKKDRF